MMEHVDYALERSRRLAWAKFFAARDDARQIAWWAVELAEYLDQLDVDLPAEAVELIQIVRASVRDDQRWTIERHVRRMLRREMAGVA